MSDKICVCNAAGVQYESDKLLLTRGDETRIYRLVPDSDPGKDAANVVILPPQSRPRLRSSELNTIRLRYSSVMQNHSAAVLYPQRLVTDDFDELYGYLGWLPPGVNRLVPLMEYASDEDRMLQAACALAGLFASLAEERYVLSMVDPEGFYIESDGTIICYLSADLSEKDLKQSEASVVYTPPELVVCNRWAYGMDASASAADYVLAVMLYRLFLSSSPFSEENLADQICDGISVFYDDSTDEYHRCIEKLNSLDPELIRLFRLCFDYSTRTAYTDGRPTAADWYGALTGILMRRSGRK